MLTLTQGEPFLDRGVWKGGTIDSVHTATVSCPDCGRGASLSDHEIAVDGKVSPSLVCPHDGCGFHEFVQLEGWKPCR